MYYKFKVRHTLAYNQPPPSDFQSDSELRKIYTPNEWFNNLVEAENKIHQLIQRLERFESGYTILRNMLCENMTDEEIHIRIEKDYGVIGDGDPVDESHHTPPPSKSWVMERLREVSQEDMCNHDSEAGINDMGSTNEY